LLDPPVKPAGDEEGTDLPVEPADDEGGEQVTKKGVGG